MYIPKYQSIPAKIPPSSYCIGAQALVVLRQLFPTKLLSCPFSCPHHHNFFICVWLSVICACSCFCCCIFAFLGSLCPSTLSWLYVPCHCLYDLSLSCWPHENWFLPITDHVMAAHIVTQFHGSFNKEKTLIGAARSSILVSFSLSLSVWFQPWANVMSYQLLLGCGGQTAECHQIANQLIQISLH